jgi:hypothetical protein
MTGQLVGHVRAIEVRLKRLQNRAAWRRGESHKMERASPASGFGEAFNQIAPASHACHPSRPNATRGVVA